MLRKRGALTSADDSQRRKQQGQHCRCYNNWNGARFLKDCLGALSSQSYVHCEIVLVDNGSSDNSVRFARENFSRKRSLHSAGELYKHPRNEWPISNPVLSRYGANLPKFRGFQLVIPGFISELPSSQSPTGLDGGYLPHIV